MNATLYQYIPSPFTSSSTVTSASLCNVATVLFPVPAFDLTFKLLTSTVPFLVVKALISFIKKFLPTHVTSIAPNVVTNTNLFKNVFFIKPSNMILSIKVIRSKSKWQ